MLAHITTDGGENAGQFVTTVSHIVNSSNWRHTKEESAIERARRAAQRGDPIVRLSMPGIDARLEIEYRAHSQVVCDIVLISSIDPTLQHHETEFVGHISASHNHIGQKYATEFLEPQFDPHVLLTGSIPPTASEPAVRATATGLSAAALEAEWLHDRIRAPLEDYLSSIGEWFGRLATQEVHFRY